MDSDSAESFTYMYVVVWMVGVHTGERAALSRSDVAWVML